MKKSLLLLIPSLFLVASCGNGTDPNVPVRKVCDPGPCVDENKDGKCDICGFPVETPEARTVKADPNSLFYLKVGEEKNLKNSLEPTTGLKPEQLAFDWQNKNTYCASLTVNEKDSRQAVLKGVKPGKVNVISTNVYSPSLTTKYNANVIDFNAEKMYLWEYKNEDKSQFGYTSANPAGERVGTAVLGDISWEFARSKAVSLNLTKSGNLGFGKGGDPETSVNLKTTNNRSVKKIVIETSSANGLAKMSVSIGNQEVCNQLPTPSSKDEMPVAITLDNIPDYKGDISIQFDTPSHNPEREEDPTYVEPGCIYIKSIWITFGEADYKTTKTYDFVEMYNDPESDISKAITSTTGKPFTLEDDDFVIDFEKVRKSDGNKNEYFETNSAFTILSKKSDEVIQSVEFNWEIFGTNNNTFTLKSSMFGNSIFPTTYSQSKTGKLSQILFEANANALRFENSNSSYVGLKSIIIKTCVGEHASISRVKLLEGAVPSKRVYYEGDKFDPTGLGSAVITFSNVGITYYLPISMVTFYDGPSYDDPADHSGKTEQLKGGTTEVVGVILGYELRVGNLTVKSESITLNLVKNISEIDAFSKYFIVCPSKHAFVLGTAASKITATAGCKILEDVDFGDSVQLSATYKNDGFYIREGVDELENTYYTIESADNGYSFGVGKAPNYGDSSAKQPPNLNWSIAIDGETGIATISMNPEEDVYRYLTCSGTIIKPYAEQKNAIAIYKMA